MKKPNPQCDGLSDCRDGSDERHCGELRCHWGGRAEGPLPRLGPRVWEGGKEGPHWGVRESSLGSFRPASAPTLGHSFPSPSIFPLAFLSASPSPSLSVSIPHWFLAIPVPPRTPRLWPSGPLQPHRGRGRVFGG